MAKNKVWTKHEENILRQLYPTQMKAEIIGQLLGVGKNSVIGKATRLGLSKNVDGRTFSSGARNKTPIKEYEYTETPDHAVKLEDLPDNGCRFPYGAAPYHFCGKKIEKGSYCLRHHKKTHKEVKE